MNVSNNWNIIDGNIFAVEFHSNSHKEKSIFYNIADITQRILILLLLIYIRMLSLFPEDICYS